MPTPTRQGVLVALTLDHDALQGLRVLASSSKAYGHLLSELIRQELVRRETRREERQRIAHAILEDESAAIVER